MQAQSWKMPERRKPCNILEEEVRVALHGEVKSVLPRVIGAGQMSERRPGQALVYFE